MRRIWTEVAAIMLAVMMLGGCATSKDQLLPHGDSTMLDVWQQETGGSGVADGQSARQLLDARQSLRRPLTEADVQATPAANAAYTRTASTEIYRQFRRLPNPDLVMYVFPHLAQSRYPVPGYFTAFPMYEQVEYLLPGEGYATLEPTLKR